jgi:hypothetical protein
MKKQDAKKTVALEKRWSTEAKQEANYAKKRAKANKKNPIMAKEMSWDAKVADKFAKIRSKRAENIKHKYLKGVK